MPLPPDPVAFVIPFIDRPVYWYGLMITLGTLVAAFVADREARRRGENPDHVWNALIVVMIFGLIGARLYHVISSPAGDTSNLQSYLDDPVKIISFWSGGLRGLGIFGALVGGVFGLWLYTKWQKLPFALWADICVVGVPLGQAIGRWGNYFNVELFGRPTDVPWALEVPLDKRPEGYEQFETFHPTFLYESLWMLLVAGLLILIERRTRLRPGQLFFTYIALYCVGRFFIEYLRIDPANSFLGLRLNLWTSLLVGLGAVVTIVWLGRRPAPDEVSDADSNEQSDAESDAESTDQSEQTT